MIIKVGQTWRNGHGRVYTVSHKRVDGRYALKREGFGSRIEYSVNEDGENATGNPNGDLVEQLTRVYIGGPMTGLPRKNFPAFSAAAADYRARGCFVISPAELWPLQEEPLEWHQYMRGDVPAMLTCEMLVLLPGWLLSKGARLEQHIARELNFAIVYPGNETAPAIHQPV